MADKIAKALRSKIMSSVRAKNTRPELLIRSALFKLGFRFRIHSSRLPGCPDIVLPKHRAVILIHGCFWHGHTCKAGKLPSSNKEFWEDKIAKNQERDRKVISALKELGWKILTVWECSLKGRSKKPFDLLIDEIVDWIQNKDRDETIQFEAKFL